MNLLYIFPLGAGEEGAHAGGMSAMKPGVEPVFFRWEKMSNCAFSHE